MNKTDQKPCCPRFDPVPWDEKTVMFDNKMFMKYTLPQIFHMPIPGTIGRMITKAWAIAEAAEARPADKDFLWLCHDPSPWKSEHYVHITHEVPGAENVILSGTFATKVFDGPYNDVPKWIKKMDSYLLAQNKKAQKYFFYYTTCPKCAKIYGHNYVVVFAQI